MIGGGDDVSVDVCVDGLIGCEVCDFCVAEIVAVLVGDGDSSGCLEWKSFV